MEKIVLVGGGGHCKVVSSIILENNNYEIVGIADVERKLGTEINGIKINYTDDQLEQLYKKGIKNAVITVGSIGNSERRVRIYNMLKKIGFFLPIIISKHSIISRHISIGEGTVIMPGAIINSGARIGKNCIINTGAIIEHDCVVGNNAHIAPGVTLSGGVKIGDGAHVGTGSAIIQNVEIGKNTLIGAGSVVIKNIPKNVKAYGIPAKITKTSVHTNLES
jgi:sugar O-acyltransferase (sialic acid O-acetyltransferase NeuD family)